MNLRIKWLEFLVSWNYKRFCLPKIGWGWNIKMVIDNQNWNGKKTFVWQYTLMDLLARKSIWTTRLSIFKKFETTQYLLQYFTQNPPSLITGKFLFPCQDQRFWLKTTSFSISSMHFLHRKILHLKWLFLHLWDRFSSWSLHSGP